MEPKFALILVLLASCGGSRRPSDSRLDPRAEKSDLCVPKQIVIPNVPCPLCGTNSPTVNAFPINGLGMDGQGECDPEGAQVLRWSLFSKACGLGADLTLQDGTLVGMRGGTQVCAGESLKQAKFFARGPKGKLALFTIVDVRLIVPDKEHPLKSPPIGYKIVREDETTSLCDIDASNVARKDLGLVPLKTYKVDGIVASDNPNKDLVIPIEGPIYSRDVEQVENNPKLFNLACADDALAKRSLYNLYSGNESTDLAALRMLTATYCHHPYTARGMALTWKSGEKATPEAGWQADHVSCFHDARLVYSGTTPDKLPDELQPANCAGKKCKGWDEWKVAVIAECNGAVVDCTEDPPPYDFESFIATDKVMYTKKGEKPNMQTGAAAK